MGRKVVTAVVVVAALVAAVYLVKGWLESDETKILRSIDGFVESINSESILGFVRDLDPEYRDCRDIDAPTLKNIVLQTFKRFADIEVRITEPSVRVGGDRTNAVAWFNCSLRAAPTEGGESLDLVQSQLRSPLIVLKFISRDGRWKVIGADYGPDAKPPLETDAAE